MVSIIGFVFVITLALFRYGGCWMLPDAKSVSLERHQYTTPEFVRKSLFQLKSAVDSNNINIVSSGTCDEKLITDAAKFLIDSFWLGSPRQQTDSTIRISDAARTKLITEQANDLNDKYGERMGKPLLKNRLVMATESRKSNNNNIVGFVCLQELLFDRQTKNVLTADESETILKNTVSSLGPKQRKQYQKSSAKQLATVLLPSHLESIVCFSNLSVTPERRRNGIAVSLCNEIEIIAKEWGYDWIYLKVESTNDAAKQLYTKLGYVEDCTQESDTALRLDNVAGEFIEITTPTVILRKSF